MRRLCKCGRTMHGDYVGVRNNGEVTGLSGLTTCGSVWICPVCNAKVMARRTLEIGSAVALAQLAGYKIAFLTLTMRHNSGQSLAELWDALSYAWGVVTAGKPWLKTKKRFGVLGFLRAVEVTVSYLNGWHVHIHCLVVLDANNPDVVGLQAAMFDRWKAALVRKGLDAPTMAGQDARLLDGPADFALSQYLTKAQDQGRVTERNIGLELTSSQSKHVRSDFGTRTPWVLLDEWFGDGDADSAELWFEFEKSSKGRRQLTWSRGLRELLGIVTEKSDEEIAAEEIGTADDDLLRITKDGWRQVVRNATLIPQILNITDNKGLTGLRALLDEHCIEYTIPEKTP
jgi:Replication protein